MFTVDVVDLQQQQQKQLTVNNKTNEDIIMSSKTMNSTVEIWSYIYEAKKIYVEVLLMRLYNILMYLLNTGKNEKNE